MVERELGLMADQNQPKPQLLEFKKFADFLYSIDFTLPKYESDAVCILSRGQRHWGIAYMTYLLARRAGMNISFTYADDELPDSPVYLLPSVSNYTVMKKSSYDRLKSKVAEGATLYLSFGNSILSGFEELTGLKVIDSYECEKNCSAAVGDGEIEFSRLRNIILEPTSATVMAKDSDGNPFIAKNNYKNGKVYFVNAPIEDNLIDTHDFCGSSASDIYRYIFADIVEKLPVKISDADLLTTLHKNGDTAYVTVINHFDTEKSFSLSVDGYSVTKVLYGSENSVKPYDACVLKLKRK